MEQMSLVLHRSEKLKAQYPSLRDKEIEFRWSHHSSLTEEQRERFVTGVDPDGMEIFKDGNIHYHVFINGEFAGRATCNAKTKKNWEFKSSARFLHRRGFPKWIRTPMRGRMLIELKSLI